MSAIEVNGNSSNKIFGKGESCLVIYPFDNYRMFTLYSDWTQDDKKPLDLSNGQKLYIVFKSKNKEIKIPECILPTSSYDVDKTNGQVLFFISKKNAVDIISMSNRVFYITREYETDDRDGTLTEISDEEVLFSGKWREGGVTEETNYVGQIKEMTDKIKEYESIIDGLRKANADLITQNLEYSEKIENLTKENTELISQNNELITHLNGGEYEGVDITSENATYIIQSTVNQELLESELNKLADSLMN